MEAKKPDYQLFPKAKDAARVGNCLVRWSSKTNSWIVESYTWKYRRVRKTGEASWNWVKTSTTYHRTLDLANKEIARQTVGTAFEWALRYLRTNETNLYETILELAKNILSQKGLVEQGETRLEKTED